MARRNLAKVYQYENSVAAQQAWIAEHGGSLSGYVARYGAADDPDKYGAGGAAIYAADAAELRRREALASHARGVYVQANVRHECDNCNALWWSERVAIEACPTCGTPSPA